LFQVALKISKLLQYQRVALMFVWVFCSALQLLLTGIAGLGKTAFARSFAQLLLCAKKTACGGCRACYLFLAGNHPDFYYLAPESVGKNIRIDVIRELTADLQQTAQQGGDGGHNGLKDISAHLNSKNYWRLRIGIGHPGQRHLVHDYVLSRPSKHEEKQIRFSLETAIDFLPEFSSGNRQKAIQAVHS
jgi:DNA polymerase III delta prime subunit